MASLACSTQIVFFLTLAITVSLIQSRCLESVVSFGDSITDTGNALYLSQLDGHVLPVGSPPYGNTFFHRPTGRYCDGRIIIDFVAESLGLPFVPPFFSNGTNRSFETGVNFAVGGATALDIEFLEKRGVRYPSTNVSLGQQLKLFKNLCGSSSECSRILGNALILMGEIGGNDLNYGFFLNKSITEIMELVPIVVGAISSAIEELIKLGGRTFLVPGNFPIGCSPVYLTLFETSNEEEYNSSTGCLNWLNTFAEYQNSQLQIELNRIQKLYPHLEIIYADYYTSTLQIYEDPAKFGFPTRPLQACCGDRSGPYNFKLRNRCGNPGTSCCADPANYVSWDGIHFTEAAYRAIARSILDGAVPRIKASSISLPLPDGVANQCSRILSNALILMGEIGGNDLNYGFFLNKSILEIRELVPIVVSAISSAIEELIKLGGRTFLVPGNFPIGCSTIYLTLFETSNKEEYNSSTGCLNWLNKFAEYQNKQLQIELNRIQKLHPHVDIIYADYFSSALQLFEDSTKFGFKTRPLQACCGDVSVSYNFQLRNMCGKPGTSCCADPAKYVSWDGIHFTEAAYRAIAKGVLTGPHVVPRINSSCVSFGLHDSVEDLKS